MEKASLQSDLPVPPAPGTESASESRRTAWVGLPPTLAQELWVAAEAKACDLTQDEFADLLTATGERFHFHQPLGTPVSSAKKTAFLRGLRLADLALAHACVLGREVAWQRFLRLYRAPLTQAATAVAASTAAGRDLDAVFYEELRVAPSKVDSSADSGAAVAASLPVLQQSLLSLYSGRGSLLGWMRTLLAQRSGEGQLRSQSIATAEAPGRFASTPSTALAGHTHAVEHALQALDAEDRFILSAHILDRQSLLQLAQTLHVDGITMNQRIKQLVNSLRDQMLYNLQTDGLGKRTAEKAIGVDSVDFEKYLFGLLKTMESASLTEWNFPTASGLGAKATSAPATNVQAKLRGATQP